jgi:hypothetical protein
MKAKELIAEGMSAVVYCGSMGDWPLLSDEERQEGVSRLVSAGIPTIVGTGAINSKKATAHAKHAQDNGALGLMVIPRVLSRGPSLSAQRSHFASILSAAPNLPAVIYNSHYYGFSTRADKEGPRERTLGITIKPSAPLSCACLACAVAFLEFIAPVPTIVGIPALTNLDTPSCLSSSERSGQSPIEPQ